VFFVELSLWHTAFWTAVIWRRTSRCTFLENHNQLALSNLSPSLMPYVISILQQNSKQTAVEVCCRNVVWKQETGVVWLGTKWNFNLFNCHILCVFQLILVFKCFGCSFFGLCNHNVINLAEICKLLLCIEPVGS